MTLWPVYIPSKGRAATLRLPGTAPCAIVVEPQEADAYRGHHRGERFLTLPVNDQGLPYARQWVKEHATAAGHEWFWMLDDDIAGYYRVERGRCVPAAAGVALEAAQAYALRYPYVGQAALEYQQYAWSTRATHTLNGYCDVAVAINTKLTAGIAFRPETDLKVDRDFTLQVLAAGLWTVRACTVAFGAPKNGSNPGGLAPTYAQQGREAKAVEVLCRLWPDICTPQVKADGRVDAKIQWRAFKPRKAAG